MSILVIDLGNTTLRWAMASGEVLLEQGIFRHHGELTAEHLQASWSSLTKPQRILISCVSAAPLLATVRHWCEQCWQLVPEQVTSSVSLLGLQNAYSQPERLGSDRWLAMLAAWDDCQSACIVVDCGSAMTIDLVSGNGQHQGGYILPGLTLMNKALHIGTANLPTVNCRYNSISPGQDTEMCICHASLLSQLAIIEKLNREHKQVHWYLTGGDADCLLPLLEFDASLRPELVLEGLAILANQES